MLAVPADLSTAAGISDVVAATAERFGGVDILVNNSGGPALGTFGDFTDDDWRQGFEEIWVQPMYILVTGWTEAGTPQPLTLMIEKLRTVLAESEGPP